MRSNSQENTQPKRNKADHLSIFRWKKGDPSPNPTGRPKKRPITDRYKEVLEIELPLKALKKLGLEPGATYGDAIALRMAQAAILYAKTDAAREIREAIEGKAVQYVEHSGQVQHTISSHEQEKARGSIDRIKALGDVIDVTPEE